VAQRLDLEELEPRLHAAGIKSTQLTVRLGVESIEVIDQGVVWNIDQFGSVTRVSATGAPEPEIPPLPPDTMMQTIEDYKNGNVAGP